ncbi:hypothetical protein D3Z48_17830 [Clostridiaceae bacterium]|nr:hypothetical protein [Clostridiaceae bacterium]
MQLETTKFPIKIQGDLQHIQSLTIPQEALTLIWITALRLWECSHMDAFVQATARNLVLTPFPKSINGQMVAAAFNRAGCRIDNLLQVLIALKVSRYGQKDLHKEKRHFAA